MIDLYTWTTPNGRKASILLEEIGEPYNVFPVNLQAEEQTRPDFLRLSPNGRIPAIVDHDAKGGPLPVFESGAILIHLAEKHGRFLSDEPRARADALQWLMFQMAGIGPFLGQVNHWMNTAAEKNPAAIQRYLDESVRFLEVFDGALEGGEYIAGEYSIADIAAYPWIAAAWGPLGALLPEKVAAMPRMSAWLERVGARPAVVRGMAVPAVPGS